MDILEARKWNLVFSLNLNITACLRKYGSTKEHVLHYSGTLTCDCAAGQLRHLMEGASARTLRTVSFLSSRRPIGSARAFISAASRTGLELIRYEYLNCIVVVRTVF